MLEGMLAPKPRDRPTFQNLVEYLREIQNQMSVTLKDLKFLVNSSSEKVLQHNKSDLQHTFKTIYELDKEESVFSFYDTNDLPVRSSIKSEENNFHHLSGSLKNDTNFSTHNNNIYTYTHSFYKS